MTLKHFSLFFVAIFAVIFAAVQLPFVHKAQAAAPRIGIIGDSNSDEYRADDNRGGAYGATTLSWAELLVNKRGYDLGVWGNWGGERRSGYKNNWARSAATTQSMIANGQHTGLAQQIAAGEIDYAVIYIGTNDFHTWNGTYAEIYNGTLNDTQLQAKVDSIVTNITLAVDTFQQAGPTKIVLVSFADPAQSVDFMQQFPDASKRQRVTNAINQINQSLASMSTAKGITFANINDFATALLSRINSSGNIVINGETISTLTKGDEPHHLQLGDSVGHIGTVGSGFLANFIGNNIALAAGLPFTPFDDAELLINAGILPPSPTPSPTPTLVPTPSPSPTVVPSPTPVPTPTPSPSPTPTVVPTPSPSPTPTVVPTPSPSPTPVTKTLTVSVNSSTDDVHQNGSTNSITNTSMFIGGNAQYFAGMRFTNVTIPQGSKILSAYVEVSNPSATWITIGYKIYAQAAGNSATFSASSMPSTRTGTTSKITHSSNVNWAANTWQKLEPVTTPIQEVVNRTDWNSGNALSVLLQGTGSEFGRKSVRTFNTGAQYAPRLVIQYQ